MATPTQAPTPKDRAKRVRGKNLAMLWTLIGLVVLFFAITVVQVGRQ
jgi:hypothetical protein